MIRYKKSLLFLNALIVLLLGPECQAYHETEEVTDLQAKQASGKSEFHAQLLENYKAFTDQEHNAERDYADAIHFARKGMDAGNDIAVAPEELADWNIHDAYYPELHSAYLRMMKAFFHGATKQYPALSATAQVNFDCWIEDQEEAGESPANTACKTNFMSAMESIEDNLIIVQAPEVEPPQPVQPPMETKQINDWSQVQTIFFDFDKAVLTPDSLQKIDRIADDILSKNIDHVLVRGHTDSSGGEGYNNMLSFERTMAVWRALISNGVESRIIQMDWKGETELMKPTPDGVKHRLNRRADIMY